MINLVTPHCHIQSLDSASTPEAFVKRELELGTGAVTVTDHGSLAACHKVYELARQAKLTPILGLEGYFRDDNCSILLSKGAQKNAKGTLADYLKYAHFTVHFLDSKAYFKGVKLLSKAPVERHGQESKPLFNWRDLEELGAENVTIGSSCLVGMVQRHLLDHDDPQGAVAYYERLRGLVKPGNFYVEIFPHKCDYNWVQGVFLTLEDGAKIKYYYGKNLRIDDGAGGKPVEMSAEDLAKAFGRKDFKARLLAVKDRSTWNEREPIRIVLAKKEEAFLQNECRPWCADGDVQAGANRFLLRLAKKYGDPVLVSDDSHYAHAEDKPVQDVRLMAGGGQWRFYGHYERKDSQTCFQHFNETMSIGEPEFGSWVENSRVWAERFKEFRFDVKPSLPTKFYPEDTMGHTMKLIEKVGRMDWSNKAWVSRLRQEIDLLHNNGTIDLLPYFFLGEEVVNDYTEAGVLTGPGRGSAAGLLLPYLLGITHADPIRYKLSLERFITLDRIKSGALPDIDQDLPSTDRLIGPDGLFERRFKNHYARISTDTTLKLRSSIKDVARVLEGRVSPEIEWLSSKMPDAPQGVPDYKFVFGYEDSGNEHKGAIETDPILQKYVSLYPSHWAIVQKALGLGRGKSKHACGYVVANVEVSDFIPLMTISDEVCTAYPPASVEAAGGVKMDFLSLNSLKDIAGAIELVQDRSKEPVPEGTKLGGMLVPKSRLVPLVAGGFADVWDLPDDQKVFSDVATGKTETVFQFNTTGAVKLLRNFAYRKSSTSLAIDSIEAMAAFTALDRPGPLNMPVANPEDGSKHNLLVEFARRARGAPPSPEILPFFNTMFPETYGILVYQEQLQFAYQQLTGCTGTEAEEFRRNVAKKKMEKVLAAYPFFKEGASKSIGPEMADAAWEFFKTWGQYGFTKSHAICYSIIAYACAYLKHHYPLEWWCSVLRNADKDEINQTFWRHAGHLIDLPQVGVSGDRFEIVGGRLRAPLSLLLGIGETAHHELTVAFGGESQPKTILEFCQGVHRWKLDRATKTTVKIKKKKKDRKTKQITEWEEEVEKVKLGHSALHRGIVYTLIVAGAMDRLFPEDSTVLSKLEAYEAALAEVTGKKQEPVKPGYLETDPLRLHQLRKRILPAYGANLTPAILATGLVPHSTGDRVLYRHGEERVPFCSAKEVERIDSISPWPDGEVVKVALAGYVEDVRPFSWGGNKETGERGEKEACEIVLEVDGAKLKFVRWGDRRSNKLPAGWTENLAGAVVVAVVAKRKEGRGFAIDDLRVVKDPLKDEKEKE